MKAIKLSTEYDRIKLSSEYESNIIEFWVWKQYNWVLSMKAIELSSKYERPKNPFLDMPLTSVCTKFQVSIGFRLVRRLRTT